MKNIDGIQKEAFRSKWPKLLFFLVHQSSPLAERPRFLYLTTAAINSPFFITTMGEVV